MIELDDDVVEFAIEPKKEKKKKINSKKKGNSNELECVKILTASLGDGFFRVPNSGAWSGGQNRGIRESATLSQKLTLVSDIMTPDNFKYVIEHKAYNTANFWDLFSTNSNFYKWFEQVESDASFVGRKPMLIVKFNNKKRIVFLKEEAPNYIFKIWNGWYCYWLEGVLEYEREFFFESESSVSSSS